MAYDDEEGEEILADTVADEELSAPPPPLAAD
jgi:hypothetical protein